MLVTTERPKPWRTAGRAWRGLFAALRRMAPLFIIAYVLMAGLDIAIDRVQASAGGQGCPEGFARRDR